MNHRRLRLFVLALGVSAGFAHRGCRASATIAPTLTLNQSAGTQAGVSQNLGASVTFNPSTGDSPKDISLILPAGLLANVSVDGGACIASSTPITACQIGTGTAVADGAIDVPATFDLVAPPAPGDVAGLQLLLDGTAAGTPADLILLADRRPQRRRAGRGLPHVPRRRSTA